MAIAATRKDSTTPPGLLEFGGNTHIWWMADAAEGGDLTECSGKVWVALCHALAGTIRLPSKQEDAQVFARKAIVLKALLPCCEASSPVLRFMAGMRRPGL